MGQGCLARLSFIFVLSLVSDRSHSQMSRNPECEQVANQLHPEPSKILPRLQAELLAPPKSTDWQNAYFECLEAGLNNNRGGRTELVSGPAANCSGTGGHWEDDGLGNGECKCTTPKRPVAGTTDRCEEDPTARAQMEAQCARQGRPVASTGTSCNTTSCLSNHEARGDTCVARCARGQNRDDAGVCVASTPSDPTPEAEETPTDPESAPTPPPGETADTQPEAPIELTEAQARATSEQYRQQCIQAYKDANDCCNDPMQCLFGVSFGSQGEMNMLLNTMIGVGGGILSQQAGADDGKEINKACSIMQTAGFTVAGLNVAGASQCRAYQSACNSTCKDHAELLYNRGRLCGFDLETGTLDPSNKTCAQQAMPHMVSTFHFLKSRIRSCQNFNLNITQSGLSAISSLQASAVSDLCKKASGTDVVEAGTGLERPDPSRIIGSSDCDNPANRNDPACSCLNPAFASLARCRGQVPGPGGGFGGPARGAAVASAGVGFGGRGGSNTGELPVAANQLPPTERIEAEEARSNGIQPNQAGAGAFGGQGGMPAQAGGGGGQPGQSGGYNTDVLSKNAVGGGGYSVSSGGGFESGGGGFSGYGSSGGSGRDPSSLRKPNLNLKDFLPGGKKDPTLKMAGLGGSGVPEVERRGAAHEDIFAMISRRIRIYCQLKGLLEECPKLKSMHHGGGL